MQINEIRVFSRATGYTPVDDLAFVGLPPAKEFLPPANYTVSVSVVWTWDIPIARQLVKEWGKYYKNIKVGGPAFNDMGGEFVPGRFTRKGLVFTSRGCNRKCPWCYVQQREGRLRELKVNDGYVIEDSNLLMCSNEHIRSVFKMLRKNHKEAFFNGGFDARLFKKWHLDLLESIKVGEIFFACDKKEVLPYLKKITPLLMDKPQSWRYCYVLLGWEETLKQAKERLSEIKNLGFFPIPMLLQKNKFVHHNQKWKDLAKEFSVPTKYMQLVNNWQKECLERIKKR